MTRVLTAVLLIPLVYLLVFHAPGYVVRAALALVSLLCLQEFFLLSRFRGIEPFAVFGYGAGAVLVVAPYLPQPGFFVILCMLLFVLGLMPARPLESLFGSADSKVPGLFDLDPKIRRAKGADGFYGWRASGQVAKLNFQPAADGSGAARSSRTTRTKRTKSSKTLRPPKAKPKKD